MSVLTEVRRRTGLLLYSAALKVCPELGVALRQYVQEAVRVGTAQRFAVWLAEHRRSTANIARRN